MEKQSEKRKKQQPTENEKNIKTEIKAKWGPVFTFSLPRGAIHLSSPHHLRHCSSVHCSATQWELLHG